MLELKDFMPVNFLKKEKFTGSYKGMRFRMEKEEDSLLVSAWPEPYGFDATSQEKKRQTRFTFDAQGIADGVAWLNEQYKEDEPVWRASRL